MDSALDAARHLLPEREGVVLDDRDRDVLLDALVHPPEPNAALRRAVAAHGRLIRNPTSEGPAPSKRSRGGMAGHASMVALNARLLHPLERASRRSEKPRIGADTSYSSFGQQGSLDGLGLPFEHPQQCRGRTADPACSLLPFPVA